MAIDHYNDIPQWHWYISKNHLHFFADVTYFYCGVSYYGFIEEPEPKVLDFYDLRSVGYGTYQYIERGEHQ